MSSHIILESYMAEAQKPRCRAEILQQAQLICTMKFRCARPRAGMGSVIVARMRDTRRGWPRSRAVFKRLTNALDASPFQTLACLCQLR